MNQAQVKTCGCCGEPQAQCNAWHSEVKVWDERLEAEFSSTMLVTLDFVDNACAAHLWLSRTDQPDLEVLRYQVGPNDSFEDTLAQIHIDLANLHG